MPQPSSTRQVSSTGLSRRCCLRASPDRPTRLRLAVPKWTRRQGEETPLGPSSGEETPISQDGMSYRVRSLPSSLFHPSNRALPSDCVARVEKSTARSYHNAQALCIAFLHRLRQYEAHWEGVMSSGLVTFLPLTLRPGLLIPTRSPWEREEETTWQIVPVFDQATPARVTS